MSKIKDLAGQRFGRWQVVQRASTSKTGQVIWACVCDCGTEKLVKSNDLVSTRSKSCGCLRREINSKPPGESGFNQYCNSLKQAAKSRGLCVELSDSEIKALTKKPCFYCGKLPSQESYGACKTEINEKHSRYVYNGIDRADSDLGYTWENCVACCGDCNKAKMALSMEEFAELIERIWKHWASKFESQREEPIY
jgi:hypothetical protein